MASAAYDQQGGPRPAEVSAIAKERESDVIVERADIRLIRGTSAVRVRDGVLVRLDRQRR